MDNTPLTRRRFVAAAGASGLVGVASARAAKKGKRSMIRLGGQGVKAKTNDMFELARAFRDFGYSAANCPKTSIDDADRIRDIQAAFKKEGLMIAECNAWGNMLDSDPAKRKAMRKRVCDQLAVADEVGAQCTVNYFGSFAPNSKYGPHPDNLTDKGFDACVETAREIVDAVKPRRAKFCLEMMQWLYPDSAESYLDLIKAVDRDAFAVHLDPVNIVVSPRLYFNTGDLLRNCFKLLGPWIVSCHAKDIKLDGKLSLHLDEVRIGLGNMDYKTYLTELNKLGREIPLMLEHLPSKEEYALARDELFKVGDEVGIQLRRQDK